MYPSKLNLTFSTIKVIPFKLKVYHYLSVILFCFLVILNKLVAKASNFCTTLRAGILHHRSSTLQKTCDLHHNSKHTIEKYFIMSVSYLRNKVRMSFWTLCIKIDNTSNTIVLNFFWLRLSSFTITTMSLF